MLRLTPAGELQRAPARRFLALRWGRPVAPPGAEQVRQQRHRDASVEQPEHHGSPRRFAAERLDGRDPGGRVGVAPGATVADDAGLS